MLLYSICCNMFFDGRMWIKSSLPEICGWKRDKYFNSLLSLTLHRNFPNSCLYSGIGSQTVEFFALCYIKIHLSLLYFEWAFYSCIRIIQEILIYQFMQIFPRLTPFIKYLKYHIIITSNLIRRALRIEHLSCSQWHVSQDLIFTCKLQFFSLTINTDKCLLERWQAHFVHFEDNICQIPTSE